MSGRELTAKEILGANGKLFAERERILSDLARDDPYRLPPNERTWWDWVEIRRRQQEEHWLSAEDTRMLHKAMCLAPSLEVFEALLEGQTVPLDRFDTQAVKAYGYR